MKVSVPLSSLFPVLEANEESVKRYKRKKEDNQKLCECITIRSGRKQILLRGALERTRRRTSLGLYFAHTHTLIRIVGSALVWSCRLFKVLCSRSVLETSIIGVCFGVLLLRVPRLTYMSAHKYCWVSLLPGWVCLRREIHDRQRSS